MIPSSLYPLVTALLSNILAQVLKTVVYYYRTGKWDFHWVIASGGGSLTLAHSQYSQMSFMYGFFFVKFLFFTVVCVVIVI